jgi:gamma-glutamyltranspeptidase / glutathione hydrolase
MFTTRRNEPHRGSRRSMVLGRGGMVCTSQPLASFAGAELLRGGANAVDAAVAAAALLGVVEPYSTGVGGDCFMLIWSGSERRLFGLNGSGRAPRRAMLDAFRAQGLTQMPAYGMLPVTVPGAVDAWATALARFGSRTLGEVLAPAIHYAAEGFPASELIAARWALVVGLLQTVDGRAAFAPPALGHVTRLPALARTLRTIADGGVAAFYRGEIADRIVAFSAAHGGLLEREDLATHRSTWVEPIASGYRGYALYELPPNGQGLAALLALNILEQLDVGAYEPESADALHLRIEAVKLAHADRDRYVADPEHAAVPTAALLTRDYARRRAALVRPDLAAADPTAGRPLPAAETVYVTAADASGTVVSLINSLYFPFGSGMVVGDTGIALQNRGYGFSLDRAHPNCVAPGKRPFHTIIPAMLFRDGRPLVSFGVVGGNVQAQAHVQVVSNLVDHGFNIQEALDRPRFHQLHGAHVALERTFADGVREALAARGHVVEDEAAALPFGGFGGGQGIMLDPLGGVLWGGSDARQDGCAIGF